MGWHPVLAQLDNVSRLFGRFPALRKISVSLPAGRCYVLLGENGAGKSTLLRVLAGLLEPTMGTARIFTDGKPEKIAGPAGAHRLHEPCPDAL
jgi:ABC-type sugar transport system ATPase subunit